MYLVIFHICCALLLTQKPAQPAKVVWNDWREEGLKGKVQQIIHESARQNEDGIVTDEKTRAKYQEVFYDPQGLRTKVVSFNEGKVFSTTTFRGTMAERTITITTALAGQPPFTRSSVNKYTFDETGKPIRLQNLESIKELSRVEYEYDEKGQRVKNTVFINGQLNTTNLSTYDAKGNITQAESQAFEGPPAKYFYTYEFDAQGNWIKRITKSNVILNNQRTQAVTAAVFRTIKYY